MQAFPKNRIARVLGVMASIAVLASCASPEQAQVNRDARLAKQFPNPADRVGMYIMFQNNAEFMLTYLPSMVSQDVAVQRMDQWCVKAGLGRVATLGAPSSTAPFTATLGDGSRAEVRSINIKCLP